MNLENLDNKEPLIKDFFTWLFEDDRIINKEVTLENEIDFTLSSYYIDANIYYPKQISSFFNTKAMKRLGRISQLDLVIDEFPNLYHNRLDHSKGVYYKKLEEMLYNFQNNSWKKYIENNNLKLYLLADLIKLAGHDIGHLPLSHALEVEIFSQHGIHESIGKRIMLENPEIQSLLTSISPDLPDALKDLYENHILNFQEHDESNYDVDRFDYIARDNLYAGVPLYIPYSHYETIAVVPNDLGYPKIDTDGSILTSNSSDLTIDVYNYTALDHIEHFLEVRESGYINMYFSNFTHIRENSIGALFKTFLSSESSSGKDLNEFITRLKYSDINTVDLSLFLDWDDLKFYSEILDIAENHEDPNIRLLATMTVPNMNAFLTMLYSHLNIYNKGQIYSAQDKQFLQKIKKLIQSQSTLAKNLKNANFAMNNTLIFPLDKTLPTNYNVLIKKGLINSTTRKVKAYNPSRPIYIKGTDGKIYDLSHHPDRKCDWNNRITYINSIYSYIPFLKLNGLSDAEIAEMQNICNTHDSVHNTHQAKTTVNMQPLQIGHKIEDEFLEI